MMPFISTGDLSEYLGQDVTADQLSVIAIDSACEIIRSYCQQRLNYRVGDVVALDGDGSRILLLRELPVVEVTSVKVDGVVLAPTKYYATASGVLYRRERAEWWPWGIQNIEVTYNHGYAVSETDVEDDLTDLVLKPERMPSDIRRVALSLARRIFVSSGTETGTKSSETIGVDSYSYTLASTDSSGGISSGSTMQIDSDERAVLNLHRYTRVA